MPTIPVRWADNTKDLQRNLKEGLNQIEATKAAADRMVQSLGGQRLIQAAHTFAVGLKEIGGAQRLTNAELDRGNALLTRALDKYKALGQQAPAELKKISLEIQKQQAALKSGTDFRGLLGGLPGGQFLGGSATAGAAAAAGFALAAKQAIAYADALTKASDRTGIGVVALQRLDAIARESGNDLGQLTSAINLFQKNIAENGPETARALGQIGLTIAQLRSQTPEQQFIAIAKGLQSIKDPAQQAEIAMQLFGRAGAELLPSLKADVDKLGKSVVLMSEEAVKALEQLGDGFGNAKVSFSNFAGEVVAGFVRMSVAQAKFLQGVVTPKGLPDIPFAFQPQGPQQPERPLGALGVPGRLGVTQGEINLIERESEAIKANIEWILRGAEAQRRWIISQEVWALKWRESTELTRNFSHELENFATHTIDVGDELDRLTSSVQGFGTAMLSLPGLEGASPLPETDTERARRLLADIRSSDIVETTDNWRQSLDDVARSWAQIGQIAPGALGEISKGIGTGVNSLNLLIQAQAAYTAAAVGSFARVLASLNVFLAAFQVGVAIVQGLAFLFSLGSGQGAISAAARRAGQRFSAPPIPAGPGRPPGPTIPRFAEGGFVGRPTLAVVGDSPGGEFLIPKDAMAQMMSGGAPSVVVNVDARGAFGVDRYALRRWGRAIAPAVADAIAQNKPGTETAGAFTTFRGALGMRS